MVQALLEQLQGQWNDAMAFLVSRFGPLPGHMEERIEQSDDDALHVYFEAALTAPSLGSAVPIKAE